MEIRQTAAKTVEQLRQAGEEVGNGKQIEDDWITAFWDIAKNKNDEEVRNILSRILTGEIVAPGSFSISTLQAISLFNAEIGRAFQALCNISIDDGRLSFVVNPRPFGQGFFAMPQYGLTDVDLTHLNGTNLIQSVETRSVSINDGDRDFAGVKARINFQTYGEHALVIFTQVGRELRRIIAKTPNNQYVNI